MYDNESISESEMDAVRKFLELLKADDTDAFVDEPDAGDDEARTIIDGRFHILRVIKAFLSQLRQSKHSAIVP